MRGAHGRFSFMFYAAFAGLGLVFVEAGAGVSHIDGD